MKSKIQNPKSKIVVVGAGPSGASLAIRLLRENFRVVLIEREKFPRHKLCGEFISPECLAHFRELGVLDEMQAAGGERITETVFYAPDGKSVRVPSKWFNNNESGALSLSRAEMDFRLLEKAKAVGVEVLEEHSAINLLSEKDKICGVKLRAKDGAVKEVFTDLLIDATGRAGILGKMISRKDAKAQRKDEIINQRLKTKDQRPKLVGFKAHLKNVNLGKGVCEIYFFRGGYGGLSFVENNLANHCFLIKADIVREFSGDANKIVKQVIFQNRRAYETLKNAEAVQDWLAVSIDGFGQKILNLAPNLLAVGDAAAFIDPFTGSGMLMAMESAEILAQTITENALSPEKIAEHYKILCKKKFQKRLRVCSLLRQAAFVPNFAKAAISALSLSGKAREILVHSTRQTLLARKMK